MIGFALFDTTIGRCAVAWTERGLAAVQLPETQESATRARIQRRVPGAVESDPPADVRKAIDGITALLAGESRSPFRPGSEPSEFAAGRLGSSIELVSGKGERLEPDDLAYVVLDLAGLPEFNRRVYEIARTIAPGRTLTYGDIAVRCGDPGGARAVGQALGRNPYPIVVPCHRVLAANGRLGGFSAHGGVATKLRLLEIEGARLTMFERRSERGDEPRNV